MYRQHVSPQTQNKRTSSLICGAKRRTGARIATFGLSVLVAGQLMLPVWLWQPKCPRPLRGKTPLQLQLQIRLRLSLPSKRQ